MLNKTIVVRFPESQILAEKDGYFENCELINSEKGVEMYGACAYLVNEEWYNKVKSGEVADKEYTEQDFENNLVVNWSYPIE